MGLQPIKVERKCQPSHVWNAKKVTSNYECWLIHNYTYSLTKLIQHRKQALSFSTCRYTSSKIL